jgi:hypothetical protein
MAKDVTVGDVLAISAAVAGERAQLGAYTAVISEGIGQVTAALYDLLDVSHEFAVGAVLQTIESLARANANVSNDSLAGPVAVRAMKAGTFGDDTTPALEKALAGDVWFSDRHYLQEVGRRLTALRTAQDVRYLSPLSEERA